MKKTILLMTILTLGVSGSALARNHMNTNQGGYAQCAINQQMINGNCVDSTSTNMMRGGFDGPSISVSTVAQAKQMSDDQKVVLQGYIIQSLGDKDYMFKDDTGSIQIKVDHQYWRGQVITPQDLIEIRGEVEKDWKSMAIDVKRIIKLNPKEKAPQ